MSSPVIQTFPLGRQWPTIDPFLFCVHHDDAYPAGNERLGPDAPLDGREIGQDFDARDGWNMYHGSVVPGFPQHPHRGFETVTFVRKGIIDHSDSLGATARFGRGDVQWLTAGSGIVHCEMFPLLDRAEPNPLELFQIWVNLPAVDKMVDPYFTMLWDGDIPRRTVTDAAGRTSDVTVIAGIFDDAEPPPPPPNSWASRPEADFAIWHLRLDGDAVLVLPAAKGAETARLLYVFEGSELDVEGTVIPHGTGAAVECGRDITLTGGAGGVEVLVLQAKPIGEPVAQYGPFVMNTEDEIRQAFADYRRTEFGGWPWPSDDPDHGPTRGRFARQPDGTEVEARDRQPVDAGPQ